MAGRRRRQRRRNRRVVTVCHGPGRPSPLARTLHPPSPAASDSRPPPSPPPLPPAPTSSSFTLAPLPPPHPRPPLRSSPPVDGAAPFVKARPGRLRSGEPHRRPIVGPPRPPPKTGAPHARRVP